MVAGILFQLASIVVFAALYTLVIVRASKSGVVELKQGNVQAVIGATVFSVTRIVIRGIYRSVELLQGWSGYLVKTQRYFLILDGILMVLAVAVFNIMQPRWSEAHQKGGEVSSEVDEMVMPTDEK